jgi:hypothetical protein
MLMISNNPLGTKVRYDLVTAFAFASALQFGIART